MSSYMHMGSNTENLVGEKDLEEFKGIILSPVNREPDELMRNMSKFRKKGKYDVVLDPQLYFPRSEREHLQHQPYFPSDLDTADITSLEWWDKTLVLLSAYVKKLDVNAVASPVTYPNTWSDDYFGRCTELSAKLSEKLKGTDIRVLTTALIDIGYLSDEASALRTASILSGKECNGYYIVFESDKEPRREFNEPNELFGMMALINAISKTDKPIIVAHCSSDMVLFKAAGASHCATGKFFNLRRQTKSRYQVPSGGGGQLAYWFEQSLMTFLRETELLRIENGGHGDLIGYQFSGNYWSNEIMDNLMGTYPQAWVGLGWRQYLSWFGKAEQAINGDCAILVDSWLETAEDNWKKLKDARILLDDSRNDGTWLRPWRLALNKLIKQIGI